MATTHGLDISKWQGKPDFSRVKASGKANFIILRASYGVGYKDAQLDRNRSECRRLGIPLGFYHYSYPGVSGNIAKAEAEWFLKTVGDLQHGELLVLDFEEHYSGNVVQYCKDFLATIEQKLNGYKPLIYLNLSQTKSFNWKPIVDAGYGLWLARYDHKPDAPVPQTPWNIVAMRQYTSQLKVDGTSGNVDANVFYGTLDQFKKYGYQKPQAPTPPPLSYEQIAKQTKAIVNGGDDDVIKVIKIRELTANI
jgi:lysozyme